MTDLVISELKPMQEQFLFSKEEEEVLRKMQHKKQVFLLTTYIALVAVVIIGGIQFLFRTSYRYKLSPDQIARSKKLALFAVAFLIIFITIYFISYFRKSIRPLIKDLKAGIKKNQYFTPGKYMPPFVLEYYIKTPLSKVPLIKIDKEFYNSIHADSLACISYAPYSKFVLSIEVDQQKINFNYSIALDDL